MFLRTKAVSIKKGGLWVFWKDQKISRDSDQTLFELSKKNYRRGGIGLITRQPGST